MNRGHLLHQSSPVQQMMTNPNWWNININTMRSPQQPPPSNPFLSSPSYFLPNHQLPSSWQHDLNNQQHLPPADSWTQLLMSGSVAEQDRGGMGNQFQAPNNAALVDIKQESSSVNSYGGYGHGSSGEEFQAVKPAAGWPHQMVVPASSPKSCVTSFSSNMLDFSNNPTDANSSLPDPSSEGNSSASGGAKKARVQASGAQSPFKVRKEKLGDRITALHQLVSPFGKTDTASVLLEAIGYIRFLQSQIEALSLPYLGNTTSSSNLRQQHSAVRGENNCIFPRDPGQLLHENSLKRKAPASNPQNSREEGEKDLRSRGLCLVPVSCTMHVGSDNGADYWAPALGAGFQ